MGGTLGDGGWGYEDGMTWRTEAGSWPCFALGQSSPSICSHEDAQQRPFAKEHGTCLVSQWVRRLLFFPR